MANHMSAREAWLIVRNGGPVGDDVATYQRACAIVEARLEESEAWRGYFEAPIEGDPVQRGRLYDAWDESYQKARALERGEGEGK